MPSHKTWITINLSLALVIFLLTLNLFGVKAPSVGQVSYAFDRDSPLFGVDINGDLRPGPELGRFCLEARKVGSCERDSLGEFTWACGYDGLKYRFNSKAYNYCTQQAFW